MARFPVVFLGRLIAVITSTLCAETPVGGSPGHLRSIRAFRNLGKAVGVDKVAHGYEQLYGRHLAPVANASEPFKLLEIGLGCTMSYGAGGSVKLWRQWVGEKLELHELEYNQACAKKWAGAINVDSKTVLHVGDQANTTDLARLLHNAKVIPGQSPVAGCSSCFDAIIDDGGHMPYQNKASFDYLFGRALKPGGVYVIEDISPPVNGRSKEWCRRHSECKGEMVRWAQDMVATVLGGTGSASYFDFDNGPLTLHALQARWVASVDFSGRAIAVVKATREDCLTAHAYCPGNMQPWNSHPLSKASRGRRRNHRRQNRGNSDTTT